MYITQASPLGAYPFFRLNKCKQRSENNDDDDTSLSIYPSRTDVAIHAATTTLAIEILVSAETQRLLFPCLMVPAVPCAVGILSQAGELIRLTSISEAARELRAQCQTITTR